MKTFRTANDSITRTIGISVNALALIADREIPADGWQILAPYGTHAAPDGTYRQVFHRPQAVKLVETWNSFAARAVRWAHNARSGAGFFSAAAPVWDGHPDADAARYPVKRQLGAITEVRAGEQGLEGLVTWNHAADTAARSAGPLKPSPYWLHEAPDAASSVFPELLLSVGLVPAPNISSAPAWTRNSADQPDTNMKQTELATLLGLAPEADWDTIKASTTGATANAATLVTVTANAATVQQTLDATAAQLATANAAVLAVTAERDALTPQLAALQATVNAATDATLTIATKAGLITPADRATWADRFAKSTANAIADLSAVAPAMNTQRLGHLATPAVLASANARSAAIQDAVAKEMKEAGCDYSTAFTRCQSKPELKPIWDAMSPATK